MTETTDAGEKPTLTLVQWAWVASRHAMQGYLRDHADLTTEEMLRRHVLRHLTDDGRHVCCGPDCEAPMLNIPKEEPSDHNPACPRWHPEAGYWEDGGGGFECDDPGCLGWDHFESNRGPEIERCDTCQRFADDDEATTAHAKQCGCGLSRAFERTDPGWRWVVLDYGEPIYFTDKLESAYAALARVWVDSTVVIGPPSEITILERERFERKRRNQR